MLFPYLHLPVHSKVAQLPQQNRAANEVLGLVERPGSRLEVSTMGDVTLLKPMQNGDVVRYTMIDR